ncbi:hypothetical protein GCM10027440_22770 [Nocardiopsis coralliicola]
MRNRAPRRGGRRSRLPRSGAGSRRGGGPAGSSASAHTARLPEPEASGTGEEAGGRPGSHAQTPTCAAALRREPAPPHQPGAANSQRVGVEAPSVGKAKADDAATR